MALLYFDGFGTYAGSANIATNYILEGLGAEITPTSGRRGGAGIWNIGSNSAIVRVIPESSTVIVGVAWRPSGGTNNLMNIISIYNNASMHCAVQYTGQATGNQLSIVNAAGTQVAVGPTQIALDTFYYVEFKVTIGDSVAANSCQLRINGAVECTAPAGADCKSGSATTANRVRLQLSSSFGQMSTTYDDLYIFNGTGTRNNDFAGDLKVEDVRPSGPGSASAWAAVGAASDWQCVDEASPDGDTTYIASDVVGDSALFTMADLAAGASEVLGVQVRAVARKDDAGTRGIAAALRVGGTTYEGAAATLGDAYAPCLTLWELNPATSAAWSESDINAMEAGVKLVS